MNAKEELQVLLLDAVTVVIPAAKSVGTQYQTRLDTLVANGKDKAANERELTALLAFIAYLAFYEGMRAGGVNDPEKELSASEQLLITAWIAGQAAYIPGLAQAIAEYHAMPASSPDEEVAKEKAKDALDERVTLWVASLVVMFAKGYASAQADKMGTWRYGPTEHCETCLRLDGQRHRLSWFVSHGYIPREPGSEMLDCKGYNCKCEIVGDDGKRLL